jgi:hypothetical protein
MAYVTPPTFAGGDPLPASDLNILGDDIAYLYGVSQGVTFSGCQVSRGSNQSIADTTYADISFTTEDLDYGGWWSSGTTITVPAGAIPAGFTTIAVLILGALRYASNGTGTRRIRVSKNGSEIETWAVSALSGETTDLTLSTVTTVAAGDTITLSAYQTSGGSLNVSSAHITVLRFAPAA